ncbi:Regulatory protein OS=Streptomyces microflavus OX=1919 GN=Smic_82040 PE=4 SV=1 [Streptomyces microflavus]
MGETSSHRTWDRLREMYRLTGQFAGYAKIQDLREQIERSLPQSPVAKKARGAQA